MNLDHCVKGRTLWILNAISLGPRYNSVSAKTYCGDILGIVMITLKAKMTSMPAWPTMKHWARQYLRQSGFELGQPANQADVLTTRPPDMVIYNDPFWRSNARFM